MRAHDLLGKQFGRLVVLERNGSDSHGKALWRVKCICGNLTQFTGLKLIRGKATCCGCSKTKYTNKRPAYHCWVAMRQRCENPNNTGYSDYGGRGITVCARWSKFKNFIADMGERPPGLTLNRKNNNLGYSPENCEWSTPKQQQRNRRNNLMLTLNGVTKVATEWAEIIGIPIPSIYYRFYRGWPEERILTEPLHEEFKRHN